MRRVHFLVSYALLLLAYSPAAMPAETAVITTATANANVCESHRSLTAEDRGKLDLFRSHLSHLEAVRAQPTDKGITYAQKLKEIIQQHQDLFNNSSSPAVQEQAISLLLYENLKQVLFKTVGLDNPEFTNFDRQILSTQVMNNMTTSLITKATLALQAKIWKWMNDLPAASGQTGDDEVSRSTRSLRRIAKGEALLSLLDAVYRDALHKAQLNKEKSLDELTLYQQVSASILGTGVTAAAMYGSASLVTSASMAFATTGGLMAGCTIGAAGAAGATILQQQYQVYSNAYLLSIERNTSFSCELRQQLQADGYRPMEAIINGFAQGGAAGCILPGIGVLAPHTTIFMVHNAVRLATSIVSAQFVHDAYLAVRSYLIYRSLRSYQQAEQAADQGNMQEAAKYLKEAHQQAQKAGAHALDAALTGIVLRGFGAEVQHAFKAGREAIIALIAKSADNAAVAGLLLKDMFLEESESKTKPPPPTHHDDDDGPGWP